MEILNPVASQQDRFFCETPIGKLLLVADEEALLRLDFTDHAHDSPTGWPKFITREEISEQAAEVDNLILKQAITELAAYFTQNLQKFTVPYKLNHYGTPFQQKCWRALTQIPYGATCSYKAIAEAVGSPKGFRAVGSANHNNPLAVIVPCHRVVGANQKMVGYGGGLWRKRWLLELEENSLF